MGKYGLLAGLVGLLVAFGVISYFRVVAAKAETERDAALERLHVVEETNRVNTETIKRLTDMRVYNEALLTDLVTQINVANKQAAETKTAIVELEKANGDVKDYLERNIPDDLRKLLNNRPAGAR